MQENDIRRVVKEAVSETLAGLGFTTSEPHELQADLLYVRRVRLGSEQVSRKVKASIVWGVIVSASSMFFFLIKQWFLQGK